ncbi:MAG: MarR family transcriptional regulator [Pseudomonadota bacterium]
MDTCRDAFGREVGLSRSQYWLLIAVARHQGESGTSLRALADHLMVAPSFVTTEVAKLVGLDLLAKTPNPTDRRGLLVQLTSKGEATLDRLAPFLQEINDTLFAGVDREEFQTVLRFVDRFVVNTAQAVAKVELRDRQRALGAAAEWEQARR